MTPTLGDFLTVADRRMTAATLRSDKLDSAAPAVIIAELDRLVSVMARIAADMRPQAKTTQPIPGSSPADELTAIGTRLLLAAQDLKLARQAAADPPATSWHPIAGDLRAAADSLLAGLDLVHTHDGAGSPWTLVVRSQPVAAAVAEHLASHARQLALMATRTLIPATTYPLPQIPRPSKAPCAPLPDGSPSPAHRQQPPPGPCPTPMPASSCCAAFPRTSRFPGARPHPTKRSPSCARE
jgi:hypothetical protein